jgi:cytochrome c peroxidase
LRQPESDLTLTGTVDNDGLIQATIPAGTHLNSPLQVSVTFAIDTYKYLSDSVNTLETIATRQAASQSTDPNRSRSLNATTSEEIQLPTISLETTANFALADSNADGILSAEEIQKYHASTTTSEHQQGVKDLMIAANIAQKDPSKLYYPTTYELMAELLKDETALSAFFAANGESVQLAKAELFDEQTPLNEEAQAFLRLDTTGWPLKDQTLTYEELPWSCVDDIRRVSSRVYGVRLWSAELHSEAPSNALPALVETANTTELCKRTSWQVPTVTELSKLFEDGQTAFPKTFPTLDSSKAYWATDDEENLTLVRFDSGEAITLQPDEDSMADVLLHSFEPHDNWFNIPAVETPVDLVELREQYSQDPSEWPEPTVNEGVEWQELGLRPAVPFPEDNPYSAEKVALGKQLFFDPRLSKDNTISCASCHDPEKGWADGIEVAVGINGQQGKRNTPTIINTAYYDTLFLDGRVNSLEEQSLHPIANPIEMGLPLDELLTKLDDIEEYSPLFEAAFGDDIITLDRIAKAIATFERTIVSTESDFDRFLKGDSQALTDQQLHGLHLFRTKARCMNCHSGPMMTNNGFENIGLTYYGRFFEDRGRYNVTYKPEDMGKFRVPMLRDIKATDPTTHLGFFDLAFITRNGTVLGLLAMYDNGMTRNRGGNFPQYAGKYDKNFPSVSPLIERLAMTNDELLALNEFMGAISSEIRKDSAPPEELGLTTDSESERTRRSHQH